MTVGTIARYLIGDAQAIREAAASKATFWIGIILVLITSIPRNYDQTYILEKPLLWVFGPLLFSIVSGTWLFLIAYYACWRRYLPLVDNWTRPKNPQAWRAFMGVFWLTAPIAWLYAIPVERFMDSVSAAKANVALLGIVSLWRVLLMTRVIQVLSGVHILRAFLWVLIPISIEVIILSFFGGAFTKRILAGMMGMRNSPEEEILLAALGNAFSAALITFPIALSFILVTSQNSALTPLPQLKTTRAPFLQIGIIAILWIGLSIQPQQQVARNWHWEQFIAKKDYARALSYAAQFSRSDFAPARPLPPKAYEATIFSELPPLIGATKGDEPVWLRAHLIQRLNEMCGHWMTPGGGPYLPYDPKAPEADRIEVISGMMDWHGHNTQDIQYLLEGLQRFPEGQAWLKENPLILKAIRHRLETDKLDLKANLNRVVNNPDLLEAVNGVLKILDELDTPYAPTP